MKIGVITKGIGGFYYIDTGEDVYECRARGKFRLEKITPLVGDIADIEVDDRQGYILNIHPRTNEMIRPAIANVDQVMMVFAAKSPDINMSLLQKFLLYAEYVRIKIIVCINKIDLDENQDYKAVVEMLSTVPYSVILTSTKQQIGIEELKAALKNKTTVFAGPSGAGKSSLLNLVQTGLVLKTGDLSKKIDRGTHTTRHAELINLEIGGRVADTPGFTSLELLNNIEAEKLQLLFPEFEQHTNCKFSRCLHDTEPQCGVKAALHEGYISKIRYEYYISLLKELKEIRRY
ncbi:MAG: ribosome small subunit-dependent GTPase A [Clostridiales bacterium GWB2_37_7]|nr:MAG: ribosome small subunit-dependent GTPase A [Clostridiales bacterium GWB2_37_7]